MLILWKSQIFLSFEEGVSCLQTLVLKENTSSYNLIRYESWSLLGIWGFRVLFFDLWKVYLLNDAIGDFTFVTISSCIPNNLHMKFARFEIIRIFENITIQFWRRLQTIRLILLYSYIYNELNQKEVIIKMIDINTQLLVETVIYRKSIH